MSELQSADRFRYLETLGETNLAHTRLAADSDTGELCVVKSIKLADVDDEKVLELFTREARVLANLDHRRIPKFVGMYREGEGEKRTLNLVQEYIPGRDLAKAIAEGKRFVEHEVVRIGIELCRILEYLHAFSPPIIHRDIKPGNVILDEYNEPSLIDFGGVRDKMMQDRAPEGGGFTIVGSYGYMPYEQFEGRAVPASDIYALGATLVFLLSHKEPADLDHDGLRLKIEGEVNVSPHFVRILERMIEPDWKRRYQSAALVRADLERLLAPRGALLRRSAAAAMLIVAVIFTGTIFVTRNSRRGQEEVRPVVAASAVPIARPVTPTVEQASPRPARVWTRTAPEDVSVVGRPVARGDILFDGRRIVETSSEIPSFWFRNEESGRAQDGAVRYRDGSFEIYALPPGRYGMSVRIDAEKANPGLYPNDFESWTTFTIEDEQVSTVNVNLYRVMHLLEPFDNENRLAGTTACAELPLHRRVTQIAWAPLGENAEYDYTITRQTCPWANQVRIAEGKTFDSSVRVELTPTLADEFYLLRLHARRDGRTIGGLLTHGSNYLAWDYRFRVE